jgi:serine protease
VPNCLKSTPRLAAIALATIAFVMALLPRFATGRASARAVSPPVLPPAPPAYVPGEVVVRYSSQPAVATRLRTMGVRTPAAPSPEPGTAVLRVPAGETVPQAIARLRAVPGVAYAVPNYVAHMAGSWIPNDPGRARQRGGWERMQWNFLPGAGVDAPAAWSNLIAKRRPGGRGVVVAVLDTGVAYRNWRTYLKSPDFKGTRFTAPYDFVANNPFPLDREGHGTFTAGEIAEATNNGVALTGLAYGATVMPLRVLSADGTGDAATIARAIRYAVAHGAQIINLSLEFGLGIRGADIPDLVGVIRFAEAHRVLVVGAAGNDEANQVAYPARVAGVVAVGATTADRCLAWYSNGGPGLTVVAPGGDTDAIRSSDPNCHPDRNLPSINQLTFPNPSNPRRFGYRAGVYGTSMATAEVAATAALVIASGVVGRHPTPQQVIARLEQTAKPLDSAPRPNWNSGFGLIDAGAATAPSTGAARRSRQR